MFQNFYICGTMPYLAPEILQGSYMAEPADLWSCGIVLVAMLAGELPWDEPTKNSEEFVAWENKGGLLFNNPWIKLDTIALSLARKILAADPDSRPTIGQILNHPWMRTNFKDTHCADASREPPIGRDEDEFPSVALSQPTIATIAVDELRSLLQKSTEPKPICFSQPTHNDDLLLGSQLHSTQTCITSTNFQRFIKRMTRFFVTTPYEKTVSTLCEVLDQLHYTWSTDPSGAITISTVDRRKLKLVFKANLVAMDSKLLLDFRLSKGCGIEFKRRFLKLRESLKNIVE